MSSKNVWVCLLVRPVYGMVDPLAATVDSDVGRELYNRQRS